MEDSRINNKANPKVKINDLLKKHFANGIWKVNRSLCFRDMAIFCNIHASLLSNYYSLCTLCMFQICSSPYYKKSHRKATAKEAQHMVNILDKAIKNPNQVQAVSAGEKSK